MGEDRSGQQGRLSMRDIVRESGRRNQTSLDSIFENRLPLKANRVAGLSPSPASSGGGGDGAGEPQQQSFLQPTGDFSDLKAALLRLLLTTDSSQTSRRVSSRGTAHAYNASWRHQRVIEGLLPHFCCFRISSPFAFSNC